MQFDSNHKIIQIDGGLGRVLCAEPALRKLAKKYKVTVLTHWPELFQNHPDIYKTYHLNREYLFDDIIQYGDFAHPEPYHSSYYYRQKHHLIQSFNHILNKSADFDRPQIYLSSSERQFAEARIKELKELFPTKKKVIVLQTYGSSARIENGMFSDPTFRSLTPALTESLVDQFPDCIFINCSHLFVDRANVANPKFSTRELIAICELADGCFVVDSFVAHVMFALQKPGVQILGSTFKENIGYSNWFKTFQRKEYPMSYPPNRLPGGYEKNQNAMNFTEEEQRMILGLLKDLINKDIKKTG